MVPVNEKYQKLNIYTIKKYLNQCRQLRETKFSSIWNILVLNIAKYNNHKLGSQLNNDELSY